MASSITQSPKPGRGEQVPDNDDDPVETERRFIEVPLDLVGVRLDQALARLLPEFSRNRLKGWISDGSVKVEGMVWRPRDKLAGGERVEVEMRLEDQVECRAEPVPLDLVFEDDDLLVIDKPAGLVVHPAAGNWSGTLQNGLLHLNPALAQIPRCGIVHRLDKDTSGLMVVAKTLRAHTSLVAQLQARTVKRQYVALVTGVPVAGETVNAPIGRHPTQRTRMAVTPGGREAITHFRVRERFRIHGLLEVRLETGRTHQIRVHLAHLRYPIVGDPVYGARLRLPPAASEECIQALRAFRRQALHAERLSLVHPVSSETLSWESPLPADMTHLLGVLRRDRDGAARAGL